MRQRSPCEASSRSTSSSSSNSLRSSPLWSTAGRTPTTRSGPSPASDRHFHLAWASLESAAIPVCSAGPGGLDTERALQGAAPSLVQSYTDHHCNNSTDRRILLMFLDICTELNKLCQSFEALHSGTPVTNNLLEKCKSLVSQSNDLSSLRAKYPHDVVNHLSCDEARNHYGGVVSLVPIILDLMKEWIAHSEKLPRKSLQHGAT
ncbi:sperm acrosome-associated protein 9 isoform X2 [Hyaena hyaena]|uniref:sperm acrosome-associated protein 9 isoform X2 n=1 Tax=Hyaena hyaena TaxID=95912 RepID=UPI001923885D|nr:sperm acrosome-associated protein 9 isoform X2 [Hyaena hyaena]